MDGVFAPKTVQPFNSLLRVNLPTLHIPALEL